MKELQGEIERVEAANVPLPLPEAGDGDWGEVAGSGRSGDGKKEDGDAEVDGIGYGVGIGKDYGKGKEKGKGKEVGRVDDPLGPL